MKTKKNPMKKMMFIVYDGKDGENPKDMQNYSLRCPACSERMEDFNTETNVFECKCGLNWKLTFTPVGKKLIKRLTVKERRK